jgi:AraC family transcriptional regulator
MIDASSVAGLTIHRSLATRSVFAQKFSRPEGEIFWRHPKHRIVVPPAWNEALPITIQVDGLSTREDLWNGKFGFCPADLSARFVSVAVTTVQILWDPDAETAGKLEPLLPFHDPFIEMASRAIAGELESDAPDPLYIESLGHVVVTSYLRRFLPGRAVEAPRACGLSRERLRRLLDYIDAHLANDLTLDALAAVACLSPYHLSRSFRRAKGTGLHRYVVQRRLERAGHLIMTTDLSIASISLAVGFASPAAFATCFRKVVGYPPSRLRNAH